MRTFRATRWGRVSLLSAALALLLLLFAGTAGTPHAEASLGTAKPSLKTKPSRSAADCALPAATAGDQADEGNEGHDTDYSVFQRPAGNLKVGMVFVDFADAPATESPTEDAAQLTPGADWLRKASYGKVRLDITQHRRWVRMPRKSTDYGFERGLSHETHEAYIKDAVTAADPDVDFSAYDTLYVVPTENAKAISFSPAYIYAPGTDGVVADGNRIEWSVTFGQDMWRWGPKVVAHETAHTFGLPDLYAFEAGDDGHRFVGGWDVMGLISGAGPQYTAWHSWKLGWTGDGQVGCRTSAGSDTVRLTAVEQPGGTKMAVVRTGPTTAYVVESRRAVRADEGLCATGALVYKVDSSVSTGKGPIRVMDAEPDATPEDGCRPLDDAPYKVGESFTDADAGVRIDVLSARDNGDTVRVTKS
ncbi:M6 family metalloprotease domain-containing protein [Streptomyces sp. CA-250714]|uniref:M6 family metalloprotease domain-containing protein n=1 Tax=Streptomyces sp. CA-250714 TaxID=3240060 RepID=UPI003D8CDCA4